MTKVLTTHNAQITTAAVEVKTLTISGKQVTQSVFRQLREVPLIAHDGTLNGVPWGYVNYHPDKCGDGDEHLHVVWQQGASLLRSRIDLNPTYGMFFPEESAHLYSSHVRDVLLGQADAGIYRGGIPEISYPYDRKGYVAAGRRHGVNVGIHPSRNAIRAGQAYARMVKARQFAIGNGAKHCLVAVPQSAGVEVMTPWREAEPILQQHIDDAIEMLKCEIGPQPGATAKLMQRMDDVVAAEAARRKGQADVRSVLAELPHLFIAV